MASSAHPSANLFAQDTNAALHYPTQPSALPSRNNSADKINHQPQADNVCIVKEPLHSHVERAVREYFAALGDEIPTDLYDLILKQVELPLLTVVLEQTRGNQSKCAQILGLNRGTLRKKMKTYHLMS